MHVLASQLHSLANRNAGLAIPPLFWPLNWPGLVALLSSLLFIRYTVVMSHLLPHLTRRPFDYATYTGNVSSTDYPYYDCLYPIVLLGIPPLRQWSSDNASPE